MNDQPKIGEYWYCNINGIIQLVPVIGIGKKYNDKIEYIIKSYSAFGIVRDYDMKDFLGNSIAIGDYVAYPGRGNTAAEYGLLLLRIEDINEKFIKCLKLDVEYVESKTITKLVPINIFNTNKIVKVIPTPQALNLFINHKQNADMAAFWVHGISKILNKDEI